MSSGGTESILLAMRTYRDQAGPSVDPEPEIVVPVSAHAAFDKAAHYFGLKLVPVALGSDWRADVGAMNRPSPRTPMALVASAPGFPHGVIDPMEELLAAGRRQDIGFHMDCCLGGFVLPWAEKLGYDGAALRLPTARGDLHVRPTPTSSGYAAKGTSVVLYRTPELRCTSTTGRPPGWAASTTRRPSPAAGPVR